MPFVNFVTKIQSKMVYMQIIKHTTHYNNQQTEQKIQKNQKKKPHSTHSILWVSLCEEFFSYYFCLWTTAAPLEAICHLHTASQTIKQTSTVLLNRNWIFYSSSSSALLLDVQHNFCSKFKSGIFHCCWLCRESSLVFFFFCYTVCLCDRTKEVLIEKRGLQYTNTHTNAMQGNKELLDNKKLCLQNKKKWKTRA